MTIILSVSQETSNKSLVRQNGSPMHLTRLAQTTVTAPGSVRETHSIYRKKNLISTLNMLYTATYYIHGIKNVRVSLAISPWVEFAMTVKL